MNEEIKTVREEPLTLLLQLPDGCTPGRWEAAEAFAEIITEVNNKHPGKNFQFIPFSYDTTSDGTNPALDALLAITS